MHAHTEAVTKSDTYEDYGMTWNETGYKIQLTLIICGLHTCELAYLLKCICSPKSIPIALWGHSWPCVELRTIWGIWCLCALLRLNKSFCLLASVLILWTNILVECLFSDTVSEFLCFFVGDFTVSNGLPSVPLKCCWVFLSARKLWCALWRK